MSESVPNDAHGAQTDTYPNTAQLSRRQLLAGSAGLAATAAAIAAGPAVAQSHMDHKMETGKAGTGSSRLYDVNEFHGVVDIAHDPTDLPGPLPMGAGAVARERP